MDCTDMLSGDRGAHEELHIHLAKACMTPWYDLLTLSSNDHSPPLPPEDLRTRMHRSIGFMPAR